VEILLRVLLVAGAMVAIWAAQRGFTHFQQAYATTFRWSLPAWLNWTGPAAAAGLLFGLAGSPLRWHGYRWTVTVLLGAVPVALLAHGALLLPLARHHVHWAYLDRVFFFDDFGAQWALAVVVGLAVAAAFLSASRPPEHGTAPAGSSFEP